MPNSSPWSTLILIALMVVAFYFLILRPQKKRQQAQARTMSALVPGTRVLLTSGIFGTIATIGAKQAVIELAPGLEISVLKQAIARVAADTDEEPADNAFDDDDNLTDLDDGTLNDRRIDDEAARLDRDNFAGPSSVDPRSADPRLGDPRLGDPRPVERDLDPEPPAGTEPTTRKE